LVTNREAALLLRCTTRQLEQWRADGRLQHVRLGHRSVRYRLSDLGDFIDSHVRPVRPPRGVTADEWDAMVHALAEQIPPPTDAQLNHLASILRASIDRERTLAARQGAGTEAKRAV
jgi:excisionase family DNA binding protein